jgi:hypothetical protein
VSVVKTPKRPQPAADKVPRKAYDAAIEVGEVGRVLTPARPFQYRQSSPLRTIAERDEIEVEEDLLYF